MLRMLIALLFSSMMVTQCTSTKKPENQPAKDPTTVADKTPPQTEPETKDLPKSKKDLPQGKKYTTNGPDQPSDNILEYFSTDYWLPQFAISTLDKNAHVPYIDMWLKFDKKGTFFGGINKKVNIKGNWKFDSKNNMLFIKSNNPNLDGKWAIKHSGFAMVWLARGGQKLQDIQMKLVNSSFRPGEE